MWTYLPCYFGNKERDKIGGKNHQHLWESILIFKKIEKFKARYEYESNDFTPGEFVGFSKKKN